MKLGRRHRFERYANNDLIRVGVEEAGSARVGWDKTNESLFNPAIQHAPFRGHTHFRCPVSLSRGQPRLSHHGLSLPYSIGIMSAPTECHFSWGSYLYKLSAIQQGFFQTNSSFLAVAVVDLRPSSMLLWLNSR